MSCSCDRCGSSYTIDLMIPDDLWKRIKPNWKPIGAGLLCPVCVMNSLVRLVDEYAAFEMRRI